MNIAHSPKSLEFEKEVVSHQRVQMPRTTAQRVWHGVNTVPESGESNMHRSRGAEAHDDGINVVNVPDGRIPRVRLGASAGVNKSVSRGPFNRMGAGMTTGLRSQPAGIESQGGGPRENSGAAAANSPAARNAAIQRSQAVREGVARDRAARERSEKALQTLHARYQSESAARDMYAVTRKPRVEPPYEAATAPILSSMNLYDRIKAKNAVRASVSSPLSGSKRPLSKLSSPGQTPKSPGSKRPRSSPRKTPAQIATAAVANSSRRHAPGGSAAHQELRELTPKHGNPRSSVSPDSAVGEARAAASSHRGPVVPLNAGPSAAESTCAGAIVQIAEEENIVEDRGPNGNVPDSDFVPEVFGCLCDAPVNEVPEDVIQELNRDPVQTRVKPINFWRWRLLIHHYICDNANKPTACPRRKADLEAFAALPFTTMLQSVADE